MGVPCARNARDAILRFVHMNVLVTGGAGFIGSHLVAQLLTRGHRVTVLDALVSQVHDAAPAPQFLARDVEFIHGDVRDENAWQRALPQIDAIIHLAAEVGVGQSMYEITRYVDANTRGTALMWQALTQTRTRVLKVVVASSMSIYGEGAYECSQHGRIAPPPRGEAQLRARDWELHCPECGAILTPRATAENKPLAPASTYAITKRDQEELSLVLGRTYDIPTVALRFFNVYGSRQALSNPYTGAIALFGARLKNGEPPLVYEDGKQLRDFIHVSDIVRALVLALETPRGDGHAFNVGTGQPRSILEVAQTLVQVTGVNRAPQITAQFRAGDIRHCFADSTRLRDTYNFEPQCAFADGVREWWQWAERERARDEIWRAQQELAARRLVQ